MDVLDRIDRLASAIGGDPRIEDADAWWTDFRLIESAVEHDQRATKREREIVTRISSALSAYTRAVREGAPSPDAHIAQVALSALHGEIRKRTIGPDGWPLA